MKAIASSLAIRIIWFTATLSLKTKFLVKILSSFGYFDRSVSDQVKYWVHPNQLPVHNLSLSDFSKNIVWIFMTFMFWNGHLGGRITRTCIFSVITNHKTCKEINMIKLIFMGTPDTTATIKGVKWHAKVLAVVTFSQVSRSKKKKLEWRQWKKWLLWVANPISRREVSGSQEMKLLWI